MAAVVNNEKSPNTSASQSQNLENHVKEPTSPIVNGGLNHSNDKSTSKHAEIKERKFDLNSFTSIKTEDDDDDTPLAARKQKSGANVEPSKRDLSPNRTNEHKTSNSSTPKHSSSKIKLEAQSEHEPSGSTVKKEPTEPKKHKRQVLDDDGEDDDDVPLIVRSKRGQKEKKVKKRYRDDDDEDDVKPAKKKTKKIETPAASSPPKKGGRKKKEEETQEVWKWWEESNNEDGRKWKFLEHRGPLFAPPYVPLPPDVKFHYDGKPMQLSTAAEEVATFYSKMLVHDYVTMDVFNKNFFKDWRKMMTLKEKETITDLKKCNFKEMHAHFVAQSEIRKNRTKEEKQVEKEQTAKIQLEMGVTIIDGHKEKIGNFRIEPPGLFRGRGSHPKMGMLKKRVRPEDVIINCSKDSKAPQPPAGHKWKEVRHDNTVTWLASWNENIMGNIKYVMLNPSSKIKGEKDWQKYENARRLKSKVQKIRENYKEDLKSKEMKTRQRAGALYFIDKLALRAGNEKEEGETADTVGCCSLRCEHIKLHDEFDGQECVVEFDFLGKDSIRYYNRVSVEKRVFKNLRLFMENKNPGDDLFDRLNTSIMNKHLSSLMDGLTAKVFRTYNASFTLQQQLDQLTQSEMTVAEKLLSYNRANRQVAILCNHQRAVPKTHGKQMEALQEKITEKQNHVKEARNEFKTAKSACKHAMNDKNKKIFEMKEKAYERQQDQLQKLEVKATDKEENKEISLGTSKLNYLDPRITVAWCKKWNVPLEKVFTKTHRDKFRWAIDMAGADFTW